MEWINSNILSCLIFCPLVGAIILALLPRRVAREGAFTVALINFVFSLHLVDKWQRNFEGYQFEQNMEWLTQYGIKYHLGVDGISLFLVLLTTFLVPIVVLSTWNEWEGREKGYAICLLLLSSATIGVFTALDLILFYVFYEAVLVPVYLMMTMGGGERRAPAAIKFFLYTMGGSVLMWIAMLYVYFQQPEASRSFDIAAMTAAAGNLDGAAATLCFAAFAIAFGIKVPIFPLHTWLPDAYTQAPTPATAMLAAVLSKMGAYGFMRLAIPLFPQVAQTYAPLFMSLSVIGIIYGALVAIRQTDMKRVLAYSSISHLGFVTLGIFAGLVSAQGDLAVTGATIQMVAHGLSTGALFLLAGMLFERTGTREHSEMGGLAEVMPRYTVLFWIALFASIGLPGLSNFVGEYLVLQGTMGTVLKNNMGVGFWYTAAAATGVITGAVYMLRTFRTAMYGEITRENYRSIADVSPRETVAMALLLAAIVWLGMAPQGALDKIYPSAKQSAPQAANTTALTTETPRLTLNGQ